MNCKEYDYIFLGAGCASLSIIMRLLDDNKLSQKKILLIDKDAKTRNDRTWCFWEKEAGYFEDILYKQWNKLLFKANADEAFELQMNGYQYKMIRGIDFYNYCFSKLKRNKNIDIIYGPVLLEKLTNRVTRIKLDNKPLLINNNTIIFNSIYIPAKKLKKKFYLKQHFSGWIIETQQEIFNSELATLMDFSIEQNFNTDFVYTLPLSRNKCLVEFTVFSENVISQNEYDNVLKSYIQNNLKVNNYQVTEKELGVIPMTNENFTFYKNGIYNIGTAGGQTKSSTGYTFKFIQKQAEDVVRQLKSGQRKLNKRKVSQRFLFYDNTLLHILSKKLLKGKQIFSILFKKNEASDVFKFLDNETSIREEIKLLNTLPKGTFIRAGFIEFIKLLLNRIGIY